MLDLQTRFDTSELHCLLWPTEFEEPLQVCAELPWTFEVKLLRVTTLFNTHIEAYGSTLLSKPTQSSSKKVSIRRARESIEGVELEHALEHEVAGLVHPEFESVMLAIEHDLNHSKEVAVAFERADNLRHALVVVPIGSHQLHPLVRRLRPHSLNSFFKRSKNPCSYPYWSFVLVIYTVFED